MSNRIEEAIRKIIFERKQRDVLLEQIIKKSLITEQVPKVKTSKISNAEQQEAKAAGAVYAYSVITRNVTLKNLARSVAAVTIQAGLSRDNDPTNDSTERKTQNIGADSIYATSQTQWIEDPVNPTLSEVMVAEYIYFIGNIKEMGKRIRCIVWIIPVKLWGQYVQVVRPAEFYDSSQSDTYESEGNQSNKIGTTMAITMKSWIENQSEGRKDRTDLDKDWYIKNNGGEIKPLPPESWYKFAGLTPAKAIALGAVANDVPTEPEPAETNVQDDYVEVEDKKLKNSGTFSGTWNNTKNIPINGTVTSTNGNQYSGDFSYDVTSKVWWLSKGIRIANNGEYTEQGTFDQSGKFLEGTVSNTIKNATDNTKTIWKYFHVGGDVDTTNNKSTATRYDASNKVIAFYQGTVDKDIKPHTGTEYTDDTKTTTIATYVNREYKPK